MESNDNIRTGRERPLSPHLQVYKLQITSALSITHRIMGCALYVGAFVFAYYLYCFSYVEHNLFTWLMSFQAGRVLSLLALVGWSFAICYHFCNGIRHLFWDAGLGFNIRTTYITGYAVIITSISLTAAIWIYLAL
jgi:succinate dehydrogenase / fumarate reductase, cytochrome b subunit